MSDSGSEGNSGAGSGELSQELRRRLERLSQELEREKEARKAAEIAAQRAESEDLTVLEASKDLWRGHDEDRPGRPDTVRISEEERAVAQRSRRAAGPTEIDVLEAAVARAKAEAERAAASAEAGAA